MEETRLRTNAKKTPSYDVENDQINTMHRSEEHTLNSSHITISYAVFCLKKKKKKKKNI